MYAAQLEPKSEPPKYPELPDSSRVTASDIPSGHPTFLANIWYDALLERTEPEKLPQLEAYLHGLDDFTSQYAMVLRPIEIDEGVDFEILARGPQFPGRDAPQCRSEKCYTDGLAPQLAQARLFELLSCLALGRSFLSTGVAGRPGMLGVKVHRGLFPLWSRELNCRAIVMIVAPIYIAQTPAAAAVIMQDDICAETETAEASLHETPHLELEADGADADLGQVFEAADEPSMHEGSLEPEDALETEDSLEDVTPGPTGVVEPSQSGAFGNMQGEEQPTNEALLVVDAEAGSAAEAETDSNVDDAETTQEAKPAELADASS